MERKEKGISEREKNKINFSQKSIHNYYHFILYQSEKKIIELKSDF